MKMSLTLTFADASEAVSATMALAGCTGDAPLLHARHVRVGPSVERRATFLESFASCRSGVDLRVGLCLWPANKSDACRKPRIFKLRCRLAPEPAPSHPKLPTQAKRNLATLVPLLACKPWARGALKSAAWVSVVWTRTLRGIRFLVSASRYTSCFRCDRVPRRVPDVKVQMRLPTQKAQKLACQGVTWPSQEYIGHLARWTHLFHRACCDSALASDATPTLRISKACASLLPLTLVRACRRKLPAPTLTVSMLSASHVAAGCQYTQYTRYARHSVFSLQPSLRVSSRSLARQLPRHPRRRQLTLKPRRCKHSLA